jgi:hypothetical protein
MKRNPIQDIKRTTPSIHHPHKEVEVVSPKIETEEVTIEMPKSSKRTKKSAPDYIVDIKKEHRGLGFKTFVAIFAIVLIFVGLYFLSIRYGHARVYVTEKKESFNFTDKPFRAIRANGSDLPFEVMIVSATIEKDITLIEERSASAKAKGTAVLYNAFSTQAQKLSINTRLVDDTGNIYYTDKALSIPGYTTSKGKVVPGSVSVGITASVAGDKYNGEPRDFTLLGFKGTPKATKIYARSKGPLSGGSAGHMYVPSSEQKGELATALTSDLKSKLSKDIQAQVPPQYIVLDDSVGFDIKFNPDNVTSTTANAKVAATGTANAILIKERDLEKSMIKEANTKITDKEIEEISIPELHNFSFKILSDTGLINKETTAVSFSATGAGTLSWKPNYNLLVSKLVGIEKGNATNIFAESTGIDKARLVLIPPWQKTLSKNDKYIKIIVE